MSTRAKFTCVSVTKSKHWNQAEHEFNYAAKFNVVMGNSEENKKFFAATPSGTIEISTIVSDEFEPGKDYFIDFTICE